tara:strand:- start:43597 stop:43989 length:393 start_codon:yes stop_codon:yes gene_type:complete
MITHFKTNALAPQKFFGKDLGSFKDNELQALKMATNQFEIEDSINELILLIPSIENLGLLNPIIPSNDFERYMSGIKIAKGLPSVKIETIDSFKDHTVEDRVVLSVGLSDDQVEQIENYKSVSSIVVMHL